MTCGDTPTYGWMGGLMGGSCQITKNQINLDLIQTIYADTPMCMGSWVDGWVNEWGQVKSLKIYREQQSHK